MSVRRMRGGVGRAILACHGKVLSSSMLRLKTFGDCGKTREEWNVERRDEVAG